MPLRPALRGAARLFKLLSCVLGGVNLHLVSFQQSVKDREGVDGMMLWDVSWDQVNVIADQRYSEIAYQTMNGGKNKTEWLCWKDVTIEF